MDADADATKPDAPFNVADSVTVEHSVKFCNTFRRRPMLQRICKAEHGVARTASHDLGPPHDPGMVPLVFFDFLVFLLKW